MQNYPVEFLDKMQILLGEDYGLFLKSLEKQPYRGFRVNTLKCNANILEKELGFELQNTPFCKNGYYIPDEIKGLGNNPLHHAGAFYMQEPSAMLPAEAAQIEEGDRVLDLCAAPGGKSTQAGAKLNSKGILWSNEPVRTRAVTLMSNIERMGIKNSVVSCAYPDKLCSQLEGFFNKIIVDAPCSGEGMFRKDNNAISEWSPSHVLSCATRQLAILNSAKDALCDGGLLVYSTCTYSYEENEGVINQFLQQNSNFSLEEINIDAGKKVDTGMIRVLPQHGGEGHFCAKLRKRGDSPFFEYPKKEKISLKKSEKDIIDNFMGENFVGMPFGDNIYIKNDKIYALPDCNFPNSFSSMRTGIFIGEIKKGRIEPSHSAFMALKTHECVRVENMELNDSRVLSFMRGEEIPVSNSLKGFTAVAVCGIILGFGKASNGVLKNKYPKGLRLNG